MRSLLWVALVATVAVHLAIVFGNFAAFFVLPFVTPWYVALPVCVFILRLSLTGEECPVTTLENHFRARLGLRPVRTFIGHYVAKYVYIALGRPRPRTQGDPAVTEGVR